MDDIFTQFSVTGIFFYTARGSVEIIKQIYQLNHIIASVVTLGTLNALISDQKNRNPGVKTMNNRSHIKWIKDKKDRPTIVLLAGLVVSASIISPEIRRVLINAFPYLIFLLCPVMHILIHRNHSGNGIRFAEKAEIDKATIRLIKAASPRESGLE